MYSQNTAITAVSTVHKWLCSGSLVPNIAFPTLQEGNVASDHGDEMYSYRSGNNDASEYPAECPDPTSTCSNELIKRYERLYNMDNIP